MSYNFTENPVITQGQFGQPIEVAKLFKNKKNGFFIEAGAYDGEKFSNTLLFETTLNWTGILIEPNPKYFEDLLNKNRKAYAIKTCLSTKAQVTEVTLNCSKPHPAALSCPELSVECVQLFFEINNFYSII